MVQLWLFTDVGFCEEKDALRWRFKIGFGPADVGEWHIVHIYQCFNLKSTTDLDQISYAFKVAIILTNLQQENRKTRSKMSEKSKNKYGEKIGANASKRRTGLSSSNHASWITPNRKLSDEVVIHLVTVIRQSFLTKLR